MQDRANDIYGSGNNYLCPGEWHLRKECGSHAFIYTASAHTTHSALHTHARHGWATQQEQHSASAGACLRARACTHARMGTRAC
eukprot:15441954-Alexandrium_andersonii.AAC.1